jgi:hypothetical protein
VVAKESMGIVAVAIDTDKGSQIALKWAIDHLISKGSTIVLIHVKVKPTLSSNSTASEYYYYYYTSFMFFFCFIRSVLMKRGRRNMKFSQKVYNIWLRNVSVRIRTLILQNNCH